MAGLATALARLGCKVTYVASQAMTSDRVQLGWAVPVLPGVDLVPSASRQTVHKMIDEVPLESLHVCQGIRGNGLVGFAQGQLAERGLRQWVVMETVWDSGMVGILKRLEYRRLFGRGSLALQGVLATGHRTADWVIARGVPSERVFPFAYFLQDEQAVTAGSQEISRLYRFIYVGRLIPLKRLDWLIEALANLDDTAFELWIVGSGADETRLRNLAEIKLGERIRWLGQMPLPEVSAAMAQADCLVLPSIHDGWGAVASEAMMQGTPVVCSDACGVAGAVLASGSGGVFKVDDRAGLRDQLARQLAQGKLTPDRRARLAEWATSLGASAGARYLLDILEYSEAGALDRPVAPWLKGMVPCVD